MIAQLYFMSHKHDSLQQVLGRTFGNKRVSVRACEGAVNLAHQLHVVEECVEGIEVREADHVGGASPCSLERDGKPVISSVQGDVLTSLNSPS